MCLQVKNSQFFPFVKQGPGYKKKDRILINDLIRNKRKYKTKEAMLILQSGTYIFLTNISQGTTFLLLLIYMYTTLKKEGRAFRNIGKLYFYSRL